MPNRPYSEAWLAELKLIAQRMDPRIVDLWVWLLGIIMFETAGTCAPDICAGGKRWEDLAPAIRRKLGVGLIQFTQVGIEELKARYSHSNLVAGLTKARLVSMTQMDQLPYVELYFGMYRTALRTLPEPTIEDYYAAVLWPAAIGRGPDFVLMDEARQVIQYKANHLLDCNSDHLITLREAAAGPRRCAGLPALAA